MIGHADRGRERLRGLCSINPPGTRVPDDQLVSFVPMEAVQERGGIDASRVRPAGEVRQGYTGFQDGDVLVAKITPCFENGKGTLVSGLHGGVGFGTTELHVLRPRKCDGRWLFYVTQSHDFMQAGEASMYGAGGQKRVSTQFLRDFRPVTPELSVQRAIADFLDRKTAAIDALIEKKERLLALLAEKRAALIHRAVTKGLDSTVPMKDSGIPWIGEIPAHWKVTRLRYLCEIRTGSRDTQDAVEGGAYPFFVRSQTPERAETWSFDGEAVLTSGDGAGVGKIFHHVVGRIEVHQRVYIFSRFRGAAGRMVYYYLKALLARIVLEGTAKSTVDSIRRPMLTDFPVAIGSIPEQQKIVEFLDRMDQRLTKVESVVIGQVARLREYRQALITAAVTGQLAIDEVAA